MRQYSTLAGIVFGQKTWKFFANLLRAKLVSTFDCAHNRARVFHLRHRGIYKAIGEPCCCDRLTVALNLPGSSC